MKVALVRHLATAWTAVGRLQGLHDEPLLQPPAVVPATVSALAPLQGATAWCSMLRRTQESAVAHGWLAHPKPALNELDFGPYEGRLRGELVAETHGAWLEDPFHTPLGPALRALQVQVGGFLEMVRRGQGPRVLFGHGVWIRLLVATVRDGDPERLNRIELAPGELLEIVL